MTLPQPSGVCGVKQIRPVAISASVLALLFTPQLQALAMTVAQARVSLRGYGFVRCLDAAYANNQRLAEDLAAARGAYHYLSNGAHFIEQNEDTLDITHDPYQATVDFIAKAYSKTAAHTKTQRRMNPLVACLTIYNSIEYSEFIAGQEGYIISPHK